MLKTDAKKLEDLSHYVGIILNNWSALTMAIDRNFCGCNPKEMEAKVQYFVSLITAKLTSGDDISDLADQLENDLEREFNTLLEDDSGPEVVDALVEMHSVYKTSHVPSMEDFIKRQRTGVPLQRALAYTHNVMRHAHLEPAEPDLSHVDSDGWTQVTRKKN